MTCLNDFVSSSLRSSSKNIIIALHKFIYQEEGDRNNRKRLREFSGFDYDENDKAYASKCEYIKNNLTERDLVSICIVLNISYCVKDVQLHIFRNLRKNFLLAENANDDECNDEEGDEKVDDDDDEEGDEEVDDDVDSKRTFRGNEREFKKSRDDNGNKMFEVDDNNKAAAYTRTKFLQREAPKFAMNFRDIEDSIRPFDGTNIISVERWIEEFEEQAALMCWDGFQKLVFAKKSLRGIAKLFILSERGLNSWCALKHALLNEFRTTTNSAQLHKQLSARKIKKDENVFEYFYQMKDIASRGNIEDEALIQYIIDGIRDGYVNKMILYGAKNLNEFKDKLRSYETMCEKSKQVNDFKQSEKKSFSTNKTEVKCYNCGEKGHLSMNCKNKNRGTKCFKCNQYGHISKNCEQAENKINTRSLQQKNNLTTKSIFIGNLQCAALFDTGSKFNIIREDLYNKLNKPILEKCNVCLIGFGSDRNSNRIKPIGHFKNLIKIDDNEFILDFYVVPIRCMDLQVIIGEELCLYAEILFNRDGINVRKILDEDDPIDEEAKIMKIDLVNDNKTIDIDKTASENARRQVREMIINYQPNQCKTTQVAMYIVLKDETPIYSRPRRLPFTERCKFLMRKVEFLGHTIQDQKISPSEVKVEALRKYKLPQTLKQLESFLGLASYFRKFIPKFSLIAKPLTDLRKQNVKFEIKDEQITAFNTLKTILSEKPVLNIFNQKSETEVHTDASIEGYGAVLLQKSPDDEQWHPVYYMSKKTTDAQRKYTSYELEILAVIEAFKKFRVYILGMHFKLVTDCNAFAMTLGKKDLCTRVARWILFLEEYDYEVQHRVGSRMKHVDALSRYAVMCIDEDNILSKIRRAQMQDENLKTISDILQEKSSYNDYFKKGELLYKLRNDQELIVVPKSMQREIIRHAHEKGHFAVKKTSELLRNDYFIPQLEEKIQKHIMNCIPCIVVNRKQGKQEGELHSLIKESIPLHTYHVDFLGPLESTNKQYKHIFVVIDSFTKFCWIYPTRTTSANEAISRLRTQSIVFGNPNQIISDRGAAFSSDDFRKYCEGESIKHIKITTGLARANGQVERLNSIIAPVLAKLSMADPTKWYKNVDKVQQIINSTYCRSTGTTPFELLIGAKMQTKEDIQIKKIIEEEITTIFNEDREEMRQRAKQQILKIQLENKNAYNQRRRPAVKYKVGDVVAIKRTQFSGGLKLKPKYLGPYEVERVKSDDTYDVIKIGKSEGSKRTSSCAEYMKPWAVADNDTSFGSNESQDGRLWDADLATPAHEHKEVKKKKQT
ncbi:uncharacterized protein LOC119687677 [Teleopsis dalmanni]|uniref:uncharacterized protein LOC119687677 n=1 Tax=Teleopsis dalmanni TaxID=139649 RepID=UPI0018CC91C1|nr:uncharacterized protein LOC119687677 [Teleopsis dalmanni]